MSVLIDQKTRLIVQGLTGREGGFHAEQAAQYGTVVVGGVTPGKGGSTHKGWPIFDSVRSRNLSMFSRCRIVIIKGPITPYRDQESGYGPKMDKMANVNPPKIAPIKEATDM